MGACHLCKDKPRTTQRENTEHFAGDKRKLCTHSDEDGGQRSVSVIAFGSLLVRCFGAKFALVCHFTLLQYLHLTYRPRYGCTACIKWFTSKFKPRSGLIVSSVRHPLGALA